MTEQGRPERVDPERAAAGQVDAVDLLALATVAADAGPAWTLATDDLNVNLLVFPAGGGVDQHVNTLVEVLIIGIAGEGIVTIDGGERPLAAGQALLVPKGVRRSTRAVSERFAYLTCHRRRTGLIPTVGPRPKF